MSWWINGPDERDATPGDFGPPQELYYADNDVMSVEEEAQYLDQLLSIEEQTF